MDLGIFQEDKHGNEHSQCYVDPNSKERSPILAILAKTDPYKFLPDELAAQVERCRKARVEKNPLYQLACRALAPLYGDRLKDIMFIPKDKVQEAKLGNSGARVIVDCTGRHLQIRADLPIEKQLQLLKQSFSTMLMEATSHKLAENFQKSGSGSLYQTCDLSGKPNSVKTFYIAPKKD